MSQFLHSQLCAAMALVFLIGALFTRMLVRFYTERPEGPQPWLQHWDIDLTSLGGFSYWRLALISIVGLFLEMMMIRWISSEIRIFAYFKNLVLIACFLGFGLGCYFSRRRINLVAFVAPIMVLALFIKLPLNTVQQMWSALPVMLGATSEVHIWGVPSMPVNGEALLYLAMAVAVVLPLFAIIALVFMPVGQMVGWYLENAPKGITAYTVNVLASIAGIGIYTLLCFVYLPPTFWFLTAGVLFAALIWRKPVLLGTIVVCFVACMLLASLGLPLPARTYWSPYQKLTVVPYPSTGTPSAYMLFTNDSWYQQIIDLSPTYVAAHPDQFRQGAVRWNAYNLPYNFQPNPGSVLILGAGMGNDVAAALRNGAGKVVAVEIDPRILRLGRNFHFERPYSSDKVTTVLDDARSYVQNSNQKFDLVVYSLLDSHTTSSHFSNIRIDNYVYTQEALAAAKRMLKPDGILIVKFQVDTPWIGGRLNGLLEATFGYTPLQLQSDGFLSPMGPSTPGRFFITGSKQKLDRMLADPDMQAFVKSHQNFRMTPARLTTDDWPYFYQHEPGLPFNVIIITILVPLVWWALQSSTMGTAARKPNAHFFFLGAGFMLLESQIISKMALLFGTTWVVNSIVITGLLLLVVASNLFVERFPNIPYKFAYAGIFITMAIAFFIPLSKLLFASVAVRAVAATLLLSLPVFFAGIVFIRSFAQVQFSGHALGSNLLGALVGGVLESLSFWTGLKALLIIAGLLYLGSALALRSLGWLPVLNPSESVELSEVSCGQSQSGT